MTKNKLFCKFDAFIPIINFDESIYMYILIDVRIVSFVYFIRFHIIEKPLSFISLPSETSSKQGFAQDIQYKHAKKMGLSQVTI